MHHSEIGEVPSILGPHISSQDFEENDKVNESEKPDQ